MLDGKTMVRLTLRAQEGSGCGGRVIGCTTVLEHYEQYLVRKRVVTVLICPQIYHAKINRENIGEIINIMFISQTMH